MSIENYYKKQSTKTLKLLKEHFEDPDIIEEVGIESADAHLEAIKFELMKRDLKKVTKALNKKNLLEDETKI